MNENDTKNQFCKIPRWIIGVLIISLGFNVVTTYRVSLLKNEIQNVQNNIQMLSSSIGSTVSSNMYQINEMLRKETSLVTEFSYEFGAYKDKKIDLLLKVKPKIYTEGDKLYFSYALGNKSPTLVEAQSTDNIAFQSKINVSVLEDIHIDLIIDNGVSRKTEKLESIYRPAEKFAARLNANPLGGTASYNKEMGSLVISYGFQLSDMGFKMNEYILNDVQLSIVVNEEGVAHEPIPNIGEGYYSINLEQYKIPCKPGDAIDVYIIAKDDMGFSYSALVEAWELGENGTIQSSDKRSEMGRIEIR